MCLLTALVGLDSCDHGLAAIGAAGRERPKRLVVLVDERARAGARLNTAGIRGAHAEADLLADWILSSFVMSSKVTAH